MSALAVLTALLLPAAPLDVRVDGRPAEVQDVTTRTVGLPGGPAAPLAPEPTASVEPQAAAPEPLDGVPEAREARPLLAATPRATVGAPLVGLQERWRREVVGLVCIVGAAAVAAFVLGARRAPQRRVAPRP